MPGPKPIPIDLSDKARQDLEKLVARLREHPFLAVLGPSGSGKSSLILAGLAPALAAQSEGR